MIKQLEDKIISETRGSWMYVNVDKKYNTYLHLDCDVLCGNDSRCMACGAPSPIIWNME